MKLPPILPVIRGRGKFPGEIAGASLKRLVGRDDHPVEDHNSPAKSPGPH